MALADALNDAYSAADYMVSQSRALAATPSNAGPLAVIGGSTLSIMGAATTNHHAEQYKHYSGWTHSIIRLIAQRIAGQPIRCARKVKAASTRRAPRFGRKASAPEVKRTLPAHLKTKSEELEVIDAHPFLDAIERPNVIMTQFTLMFVTIASLELTGVAYWWFHVTEEGRLEIWHLPSSWVEPVHDDGDDAGALYSSWLVRPDGMATAIIVPGKNILMIGYPDPANPLNQVSPLQANARAVITDEAIQEANRRSMNNSINPGLALIVGRHPDVGNVPGQRPVLTVPQQEQLIAAIKARYRGVVNTDEPLILDGLIEDVKKITLTPRELDFLASAGLSKERLTQGWGVNPVSMGQLEGANRASSATADDHLCGNVINPKITLISQVLTVGVQRIYDDPDLCAYIEEAHAVDPDYELAVETAMVDRGAMDRNEWRARHHMSPLKEGNSAFVGGVEIFLDREDGKSATGGRRYFRCLAKGLSEKGYRRLFLKRHSQGERQLARDLRRVFVDMGKEVVQEIQALAAREAPPSTWADAVSTENWEDRIKATSREHIERLALAGALTEWELFAPRRASGAIDTKALPPGLSSLAMNLPKPIRDALNAFTDHILSQPYWTDLAQGVRQEVSASINAGVANGESGEEVAKRISRLLGPNQSAFRSMRIARTEITGALNAGHAATREKLDEAGLLKGKRWLCISDNDTRDTHRRCSGQTVRNDQFFTVGGEKADYPGDTRLSAGERVNCRCACLSITSLDDD